MKHNLFRFLVAILSICPAIAFAGDKGFVQWHQTNVQILRGFDYKLGDENRTVFTLEHANKWTYGDFFIFADSIRPDDGASGYYIEPTLRVSLSKVTGKDLSAGIVKDVLLSGQVEKAKDRDIRVLGGFSVDLDLPGFTFFTTNYFIRDNPDFKGHTYQATFVWNRPFTWGNIDFLAEGFADFSGSEGAAAANQLIVPRVLADVGTVAGFGKNKLWVGTEWQYWHNKFGIKGVTESAPQLQVKYVF